jgi:predicted PurR-regulated permease PerM
MVIAADYPFLDVLWTIIIFFAWVAYIWILVSILTDVFRRRDIGGWAKAAWCVFMIVLPFLGVLAYLIAQHDGMAERSAAQVKQAQQQMDDYVKSMAGSGNGAAGEIEKAKKLLDSGTINQAEFNQLKTRALAAH